MNVRRIGGQALPLSVIFWQRVEGSFDCGSQNSGNNSNNNNARDSDDDSDGNSSSSSFHRSHFSSSTASCTPSSTVTSLPQPSGTHNDVSRGAVAGIAVGVVAGFLALLALFLCFWMRYRRRNAERAKVSSLAAVPVNELRSNSDRDSSSRLLGDVHQSLHPMPSGSAPLLSTLPAYTYISPGDEVTHAPRAMTTSATTMRNLERSTSISSLPNPHDQEEDPMLRPFFMQHLDRALPPLPESPTTVSSRPNSSTAAADLSRGLTQTSHRTTATTGTRSSLHDEMAAYQKRLEIHHEKEMNTRDDVGGSGMPSDPPPVYQEAIPEDSTE